MHLRVHLVRHALTDEVDRVLSGRGSACSLNRAGRMQAECLAAGFAQPAASHIFSSPQLRARETAAALASALKLDVEIEPALDEIDFGTWTGQTFAALSASAEWGLWNAHRGLALCRDGETMLQVQARIVAFAQKLHRHGTIREAVLVSHGDVLKSLVAYMLCLPLELLHRIEISPASHSIFTLNAGDARVELINRQYSGGFPIDTNLLKD